MKHLSLFTFLFLFAFLFFSCASPAKHGERFAEKENKICEDCQEKMDQLEEKFSNDFNPSKYSCRQEVKDEWKSHYIEISKDFGTELSAIKNEMEQEASTLSGEDLRAFMMSYSQTVNTSMQKTTWKKLYDMDLPQTVLRSISMVMPRKPDSEQIKKDLANRTISDVEGGYYYENNKLLRVEDYDVTELKVVSVEADNSSEYTVMVSMTLLGKVNRDRRFDVQCKVRYTLPEYDDWSIDYIRTETFTPVSSTAYTGCVKLNLSIKAMFSNDLCVKNECDKALEVFVRYRKSERWYKKVVVANAQDNTLVDWGVPYEYLIDYVMPL